MSSRAKPTARKDNIVVQEFDNELLIYDLRANRALCLNQTSAAVWRKCNGLTSVTKIKEELARETRSAVSDELVWLALDQLKKEKLIEAEKDIPNSFGGVSRREVIRRIGVGSMMALPVIIALAAPSPVHAQSACVPVTPGCACPAGTMAGVDCTATAVVPCMQATCRCVSTGGATGMILDDCIP